jgi:hypothetical protein
MPSTISGSRPGCRSALGTHENQPSHRFIKLVFMDSGVAGKARPGMTTSQRSSAPC